MPSNPLRPVLERLAYVIWAGLTAISAGVLLMSVWFPWPAPGLALTLQGFAGFLLSRVLHWIGHRYWHFTDHENSFEILPVPAADLDLAHERRADDLRRLLHAWDDLDAQRARGEADIWEVHALRRETQTLLRADPRLRSEFGHEIARHPALGEP